MNGASNAKKLLEKFNHAQYQAFILNPDEQLILPQISSAPGIGASKRKDVYKKRISHPESKQHIKFITKNDEIHAFLWQSKPEQIKKAIRWGIIKTHSITGKIISALGNYRLIAHKRVAKGMISNSQILKLKLLDLYQDRIESLHDLESLVNKNNNIDKFETKFAAYIRKLKQIKSNLNEYFKDLPERSGLDQITIDQIEKDLQEDIERATSYLDTLDTQNNLHAYNRARGNKSILEFVKQQIVHNLYELQGINQDITYSSQRDFALTRGELNDFIEDARKELIDHEADMRNAITDKHHGLFNKNNESLITYDFSEDHLSPEREREVLLAISFIEGWDKFDNKTLTISNESGSEQVDVINATHWKTHRNFTTLLKSVGFFILDIIKGFFIPTRPWEEESWNDEHFHLFATELWKHTTPNEPLWLKPVKLFRKIGYALSDIFNGISNFGDHLIVKTPHKLRDDWDSCDEVSSLSEVLKDAEIAITDIKNEEQDRLSKSLNLCGYYELNQNPSPATSTLATVEYTPTAGEQNDILTSIARGLNEFGSKLTHNLFAKDPVAGLLFSSSMAIGAGAIYLPSATASIFGTAYVNWFSNFAYSMGSSKFAAALSGSSTQAQFLATIWDGLMHGPNGIAINSLYQVGEDPLTKGTYLAVASGIGYLLVNGIAGYTIPWLSELLKEDLGSSPTRSYPLIGAKAVIMLYEVLTTHKHHMDNYPELSEEFLSIAKKLNHLKPEQQIIVDRFILASWLSMNAETIPKLKPEQLFDLSRHIDRLFDKEQSESLKKIIKPEVQHSIAFELFSIPLAYIPAVLRLMVSPIMSLCALGSGKKYPFAPMKRAAGNLFERCKKDLSRLIVFFNYMASLTYLVCITALRAIAYTVSMLIGRIAGFFDVKPSHAIHKVFASIHLFFRTIGEFLYPARAIKSVTIANPVHTLNEIDGSYKAVLKQIIRTRTEVDNEKERDTSEYSYLSFDHKKRTKDTAAVNENPIEMPPLCTKV